EMPWRLVVTAMVERSAHPTPGPGPGFTAMVVDDHPLLRESMVARLMAMGARDVLEAASVSEARARAHAGGPRDLCVLDVGLPGGPQQDGVSELSGREVEVLKLVADGRSNKEIGETLGLSALTVKSHLARIARKLGTGDRAEMVAMAMRAGVIR